MSRRVAALAAASLTLLAAPASAGSYSVKIELPRQWAHGQRGAITLVGVAPPKAPYTSSLVLYATKLTCLPSGWAFLGRHDLSAEGYVLGAGVFSRFTYRDPNVPPPKAGDRHLCAYLMTVTTHATLARATLNWR
jgi:hypothetical protein